MRKIWLFKSYSDENDIKAVSEVIKRGTWWVKGPDVEEFEKKVSERVGRQYGISFNSGTSALYANLLAYNVKGGEVIVPSYTFAATPNSVVAAGANPIFADIEEKSLGLDPEDVKRKISSNTKAIMPIHFAGDVCGEIKALREIADYHGILLIEDAAHSIGAKLRNEPVGSFGDSAMFSFCFNKIITTGEGGMIVTDSKELSEKLKLIRSHGETSEGSKDYVTYGFNFRMSSMTAALGLSQFKKLDMLISRRREMASYLNERLKTIDEIKLPIPQEGHYHVYQLYNLQLKDKETRDGLMKYLEGKEIPTRITYKPMHLYTYYRDEYGWNEGDLPVTERIWKRILTLPFHPDLERDDLDFIVEMVKEFMETQR